jgi:hypothetical protein
MQKSSPTFVVRPILAGLCAFVLIPASLAQTSIRSVKVLDAKDTVEIEVEASDRLAPQTRVLTGPDRLVIDFPNSTPGSGLRNQSVNRGEVKDLRFGLFQSSPPVTRLVLDLKTAQSFQVFPYGRTVMIKVTGDASAADAAADAYAPQPATRPGLVEANYVNRAEPVTSNVVSNVTPNNAPPVVDPPKPLEVTFRDGLLAIRSNKATLSEVLFAVQQRTGAEISVSAGADQEKVVADIGPAPAREVLAQQLNGSRFNFLILNAASDPRQLDRVILTPRPDPVFTPSPVSTAQNTADDDDTPAQPAPVQPQPQPARVPNRMAPNPTAQSQGEGKPQDTDPDQ